MGIRKSLLTNQALLAKVAWRIHSGGNGTWAIALRNKYLKDSQFILTAKPTTNVSPTGRGMIYGAKLLDNGASWSIKDGSKVAFWLDNCLGYGRLLDVALNHLNDQEKCQKVFH